MKRVYTTEELEKIVIKLLGIVDYDIQKEQEFEIEDTGSSQLVDELVDTLVIEFDL